MEAGIVVLHTTHVSHEGEQVHHFQICRKIHSMTTTGAEAK